MKKYGFFCLLLPITMVILPLICLQAPQDEKALPTVAPVTVAAKQPETAATFRLLHTADQTVETLDAVTYICGVVAAEMPATYGAEALKAQAVAAYTFACRRRENAGEKAYDVSDDCSTDQAFISETECRKKWGKNAEAYLQKIQNAVKSVAGERVLYHGQTALTVYHAISSGKTESSADIWGGKVPYLIPVESPADKAAENYQKTVTVSEKEFLQKLNLPTSGKTTVGKTTRTESGAVKSMVIGGKSFSGKEIRSALGLRSPNFEITCRNGQILLTTYGYGHGVGMSQNGAGAMAKQGKTYREILLWYYPGCTVGSGG